ncbi:hypothetical protein MMC20_002241 [Loxospora ochrophaea]|nr:hypothetical protein [Loxospora ochrophaea]
MANVPPHQKFIEKVRREKAEKEAEMEAKKQAARKRLSDELRSAESLTCPPIARSQSFSIPQMCQPPPRTARMHSTGIAELECKPFNSPQHRPEPLLTPPVSPQFSRAPPTLSPIPPTLPPNSETILELQQSLQDIQTSIHNQAAKLSAVESNVHSLQTKRELASRERLQALLNGALAEAEGLKQRERCYREMIDELIKDRTRLEGEMREGKERERELEAQLHIARREKDRLERKAQGVREENGQEEGLDAQPVEARLERGRLEREMEEIRERETTQTQGIATRPSDHVNDGQSVPGRTNESQKGGSARRARSGRTKVSTAALFVREKGHILPSSVRKETVYQEIW